MAESESQDANENANRSKQAYQVVARRYRPQTFAELIGQEHIAKALGQAITSGRVGHAYLFTGARGVGKTSAARILAKALNCVTGPTPTPCNECEVCQSVTSGSDVDVLEIDGASNRGIDEIRQLRQNAALRPSRVRYKIYIIDEVHMLTREAFNSLLKTLEEPPEHVKFIFATTEPNKIPITILSRCQRFDFSGIESASIERRLSQIAEAEGVMIDEEALAVIAMRAAGSMRDSQSLLEQLLAVTENHITAEAIYTLLGIATSERVEQLIEAVTQQDAAAALAHLDEAIAGGADVGQIVDQLLGTLRDLMAVVVGCDASQLRYVLRTRHERTLAIGKQLGVHTVLAMIQILDQAAARMRVSLHTRTLAEMALVRIAHLDDLDDLATTVAELRSGEGNFGATGGSEKKNSSPPRIVAPAPPVAKSDPIPSKAAPATTPTPTPASLRVTSPVDPPANDLPAKPAVIDPVTLAESWRNVAAGLEGMLVSHVRTAAGVHLADDETVVVNFPASGEVSKSQCERPENLAAIERALAQQVGRAVKLRFEIAKLAPTDSAAPPPRRMTSRRQLLSEIAERPFVSRAMELFAVEPGKLKVTPPEDKS